MFDANSKRHQGILRACGKIPWLLLLAAVAALLLLAACASEGGSGVTPPSQPAAPGKSDSTGTSGYIPSTQQRMLVGTANMTLVVANVRETLDRIGKLATDMGGWAVSSDVSAIEEGDEHGRISIRVPADRLDEALKSLRGMAQRVQNEKTDSQDVTEEYVDLDARLKNLEASEQQYVALLKTATTVSDVVQVQNQLTSVRGQIEQIKARMQLLERTSSTSLINVTLTPSASQLPLVKQGWSVVEAAKAAVRGLVVVAQGLIVLAIWLLVFSPLWGSIAAIGILLGRRSRKRQHQRQPPSEEPKPQG